MKSGGRSNKKTALETDLYPSVKSWLESNGYEVHGEVRGCDIAARQGEELVLIELKLAINLELVLQLLRRQEAAESVYAAVPAPRAMNSKRWRELTGMLKRLEVGLIVVFLDSPHRRAELLFHPHRRERRPSQAKGRALLREMSGRSADLNLGGSTRRKIMTAYREQALITAELLAGLEAASPKMLKEAGASSKAGNILLDNHYGWFERLGKGRYSLSAEGRKALEQYRDHLGHKNA